MSEYPEDLKYASSHEWVRRGDDGTVTMGISSHAQALLGDLVYVELPDPGQQLSAGKPCAVVESVKAASDVYSPVNGEVVAINDALADAPELVNQSPYENGWLCRVKTDDDLSALLDAADYAKNIADEDS